MTKLQTLTFMQIIGIFIATALILSGFDILKTSIMSILTSFTSSIGGQVLLLALGVLMIVKLFNLKQLSIR